MKGRTCVLVTHHVKLCLPVAALLVRMSNGKAEIIEKEDGQFGDDTTSSEPSDDDTIAVTPSSKDHTPGTMTPVGGALISKENREVVSRDIVFSVCIRLMSIFLSGLRQAEGIQDVLESCGHRDLDWYLGSFTRITRHGHSDQLVPQGLGRKLLDRHEELASSRIRKRQSLAGNLCRYIGRNCLHLSHQIGFQLSWILQGS